MNPPLDETLSLITFLHRSSAGADFIKRYECKCNISYTHNKERINTFSHKSDKRVQFPVA